jgi:hypothetical protein
MSTTLLLLRLGCLLPGKKGNDLTRTVSVVDLLLRHTWARSPLPKGVSLHPTEQRFIHLASSGKPLPNQRNTATATQKNKARESCCDQEDQGSVYSEGTYARLFAGRKKLCRKARKPVDLLARGC